MCSYARPRSGSSQASGWAGGSFSCLRSCACFERLRFLAWVDKLCCGRERSVVAGYLKDVGCARRESERALQA